MCNWILVRYGEFTIKGRNRKSFERRLVEQISNVVDELMPQARLIPSFGRMYIELPDGANHKPLLERLQLVFGIVSLSPVIRTQSTLDRVTEAAIQEMEPAIQSTPQAYPSFRVSVRRVDKSFPLETHPLLQHVAKEVLLAYPQLTVDLRNPDIHLHVEVQPEGVLVYTQKVAGAGGDPPGMNGTAMVLLSGGIDSPVAAYQMMRKGLAVEFIHYHSYPYTSLQARDKVIKLVQHLSSIANRELMLHLVPFTEIQTAFAQAKQDKLMITLMRRSMLRIATQLASLHHAHALVTGDSLGQVASQTLASMNVIGRATELPLLRPLIAHDKQSIIDMAQRIGTYRTSILPYEDCCTLFIPRSPSTNPNLNVVLKVESLIEQLITMEQEAVHKIESICILPKKNNSTESKEWF